MKYLLTILAFVLAIGVVGCDDESSNPADSNNNTQNAPAVPQMSFNGPNTTAQDPKAQLANTYSTSMNGPIAYISALSSAAAQQTGSTYTWVYNYQGDIYTLMCVRQNDGSYVWTLKYTGTLIYGTLVTDFTLWQGTTSADGKNGSWTLYTYGYFERIAELIYSTDTNNIITGTWYVYDSRGLLISKTIVVNEPDGSGEVKFYDDGVHISYKSEWYANGSGNWWIYDLAGRETDEGSWG